MSRKEDKDGTAIVTVNIDDFTRTRDSVIVSLAALQSAVSDLSRAYINHANTVLNRGPSTLDLGGITNSLFENGLLTAGGAAGRAASPGARSEVGKKKRKRVHDPNAPKRALTPYFLYMQHNRPLIANELGKNARPKEVADEGTHRWGTMPDSEKKIWKDLYAQNLAAYQKKVEAYKAGLPIPNDETAADAAAQQLQQGVHQAQATDRESSEQAEESSDSESEAESSPEPAKEPTPPPRKRRRESRNAAVATPVPAKKSSPEKKKRSKPEDKVEKLKRSLVVETPKSEKKSRKKRKSEVASED